MNYNQRCTICELFKSGKTQSETSKQLRITRQQEHRTIERYKELMLIYLALVDRAMADITDKKNIH